MNRIKASRLLLGLGLFARLARWFFTLSGIVFALLALVALIWARPVYDPVLLVYAGSNAAFAICLRWAEQWLLNAYCRGT